MSNENDKSYFDLYMKYKNKYLNLKKSFKGGVLEYNPENNNGKSDDNDTIFSIYFKQVTIIPDKRLLPRFKETLDESKPAADRLEIKDFIINDIGSIDLSREILRNNSLISLLSMVGNITERKVHRFNHYLIDNKICNIIIEPCHYYNGNIKKYKSFDLITTMHGKPNYFIAGNYTQLLQDAQQDPSNNDKIAWASENVYKWIGQNNSIDRSQPDFVNRESVNIYIINYDLTSDEASQLNIDINKIDTMVIWDYLNNMSKAFVRTYNMVTDEEL